MEGLQHEINNLKHEITELNLNFKTQLDTLNSQIFELKAKLLESEEERNELRVLHNKVQLEFHNYKKVVEKVINDEQFNALAGKKVYKWSEEIIQKSIIAKQIGGDQMLNFSRKYLIPLCAPSTLSQITQNLVINTGILHFNLEVLSKLIEDFEPHERIGDIKIDEKSIIEGLSYDASSNQFVGYSTLPKSGALAKNVLVVLLTLMKIRIKIVVGFHFTKGSTDGNALKDFLFSLICVVENKCGIKINMIGCDMGPVNVSFLKTAGLSTCRGSRQNYVLHPNDQNRKLKINFDIVHHVKNLANGLRNSNVLIPKELVQKFNLSSSIARLNDIKKLFNEQKKMIYKPAPLLKHEILHPDHFERMQENTAYNLIGDDVVSALNFLSASSSSNVEDIFNSNFKINATSWFLSFLNKFSSIMLRQRWTKDNFEEYRDWLLHEAIPIFEMITFETSHLRCISGLVITVLSTIQFVEELFNEGLDEIDPEWMSNNSIENFFSQVVRFRQKPSALHIIQSIKSLSLSKFMQVPVNNSNYSWSFSNVSTCGEFLKILRSNSTKTSIGNDMNSVELEFEIPDTISWKEIFKNKLEFNSFVFSIMKIIENFIEKISCDRCKSKLLCYTDSISDSNVLLLLKSKDKFEPSPEVQEFFMIMEFIFQMMQKNGEDIATGSFKENFVNFVVLRVDAFFEHCSGNTRKLIVIFVKYRVHIELKCRNLHKRDKHASKVN